MRNTYTKHRVIAVSVVMLILAFQGLISQSHYYYYQGNKIQIELDTEKLFLKFSEDATKAEKLRVISTISLSKSVDTSTIQTLHNFAIISMSGSRSITSVINTISSLNSNNSIMIAAPFFTYLPDSTSQGITEQFIVKLKNSSDLFELEQIATETNTTIYKQNEFMPDVYTLIADKNSQGNALEMANLFYESGKFEFCQPNFIRIVKPSCATDPSFIHQWALKNTGQNGGTQNADINICKAWEITQGCSNIKIAVVDEGVDITHPDLKLNLLTGFDATGRGSLGNYEGTDRHGTACAGIIAALKNNTLGGVGVAPNCKLIPIRSFINGVQMFDSWGADGISWAWQNGADILSNSWTFGAPSDLITTAINNATTYGRDGLGCVVVFSSGNDYASAVKYPASLQNTIAVGATDANDARVNFSNYGNKLDIVAPGVKIYTTNIDSGYDSGFNGTSASCPFVAGVAALVLSVNPHLTQSDVRRVLSLGCDKVGGQTYHSGSPYGLWNAEMGYGRINAYKAIRHALDIGVASCTNCSGMDQGETNSFRWVLSSRGNSGLAAGTYIVKRHEITTTITYPYTANKNISVSVNGFSAANPNNGNYYASVETSETSATIKTWVYNVQNSVSGQQIGRFVPAHPSDVRFNIDVMNRTQDDIFIQSQNVNAGVTEYNAIGTIETANYSVSGNAELTLRSLNRIVLNQGTNIQPGPYGRFTACTNSLPECIEPSYMGSPRNGDMRPAIYPQSTKTTIGNDMTLPSEADLIDNCVTIFPNPNYGSFYLRTKCDPAKINKIEIFDTAGRGVYESVHYDIEKITLPAGSRGSFVLRMISNSGVTVKKIIVR